MLIKGTFSGSPECPWYTGLTVFINFFLQKSNDLQERASYLYLRGVFYMADHKNMEALGDLTRLAEIDIALVPEQYVFV